MKPVNIISISYSLDSPSKAVTNFDNIMEIDSDTVPDNFPLKLDALEKRQIINGSDFI